MQTCMLTCAAVIQSGENFLMGQSIHGKIYCDGHIRYRKSIDIMMTGVQNIVTCKHATYLEFPPLGFEPRFSFWAFY